MSVAFILRPDVGPVISRALARTVGTAVGVGIAALVALTGNADSRAHRALVRHGGDPALGLAPLPRARRHDLHSLVFVFLGLLGSDRGLFAARIIDTALAAGVVLILDVCVWTTAPSMRPAPATAAGSRGRRAIRA